MLEVNSFKFLGKVICVKFLQESNAPLPIYSIESGKTISFMPEL